jgi:hypothetical protein
VGNGLVVVAKAGGVVISPVLSFGISPGERALDLGCDDGTTALPAGFVSPMTWGVDADLLDVIPATFLRVTVSR